MAVGTAAPRILSAQGPVAGSVRDAAGNPVVGAEVSIDKPASARVITDDRGRFVLANAADGAVLSVRRIGFKPLAVSLTPDSRAKSMELRLEESALQLVPVVVSAKPEVFDMRLAGWNERRKKGLGGTFVQREQLDRVSTGHLVDALRDVPGLRIGNGTRPGAVGGRTVRLRGASCPPQVFVDGFPATAGEFDLDIIDPWTVEGIEIYHGVATVPATFLAPKGGERCGVIAVWSRPYRPPPRKARSGKSESVAALLAKRSVFLAGEVDIAAELREGTAKTVYPDTLLQSGMAGRVLTEFVVDTSGYVELGTEAIVSSTHSAFSRAALEALRAARFKPALKDGRPVRQVTQLPFVFQRPQPSVGVTP